MSIERQSQGCPDAWQEPLCTIILISRSQLCLLMSFAVLECLDSCISLIDNDLALRIDNDMALKDGASHWELENLKTCDDVWQDRGGGSAKQSALKVL